MKLIFLLKVFFTENIKIYFKAMDQPDHMIDMVILLSVNFCPCKIRYQVKNLWDQRKAIKVGLLTLEFL